MKRWSIQDCWVLRSSRPPHASWPSSPAISVSPEHHSLIPKPNLGSAPLVLLQRWQSCRGPFPLVLGALLLVHGAIPRMRRGGRVRQKTPPSGRKLPPAPSPSLEKTGSLSKRSEIGCEITQPRAGRSLSLKKVSRAPLFQPSFSFTERLKLKTDHLSVRSRSVTVYVCNYFSRAWHNSQTPQHPPSTACRRSLARISLSPCIWI
jgi:hypothetical protein